MTIGERIKKARKNAGFSQTELANKVGITNFLLYKYENEIITNIPSSKIERIADATGVSPAYLMGWEESASPFLTPPTITTDTVTVPVLGEVAAGYNGMAAEDFTGDTVEIPASYIAGNKDDYFVLNVHGDSMYPLYHDKDKVLVKKQDSLAQSGDIGVVLYEDEMATLKKVEYVQGEDWMKLIPINLNYGPKIIEGEDLEHCRILGVPKLLIRNVD